MSIERNRMAWLLGILFGLVACSTDTGNGNAPPLSEDSVDSTTADTASSEDGGSSDTSATDSHTPSPDTASPADTGASEDSTPTVDTSPAPDTVPPDDTAPPSDTKPAPDSTPADDTLEPPQDTDTSTYCEPYEQRCLTETIAQSCAGDGTHWIDLVCENGDLCFEGICGPVVCEPGAAGGQCASPTGWAECNSAGTGYVPVPCAEGETCYEGECVSFLCNPGDILCYGMVAIQQCEPDGSAWTIVEECEPGGQCVAGTCLDACQVAATAKRAEGCAFHAIAMDGTTDATSRLAIGVAPDAADSLVTVTELNTGSVLLDAVLVEASTVLEVPIPTALSLGLPKVSHQSLRVDATAPVSVVQATGRSVEDVFQVHDISRLRPHSVHGHEHLLPSWPSQEAQPVANEGTLSVVATAPGVTKLELFARADIETGTAGSEIVGVLAGQKSVYTLDEGETLHLKPKTTENADLTGSLIRSDQALAVFSGHVCGRVPNGLNHCSHLQEQVPAVEQWGQTVVALPFAPRSEGQYDVWRVMAGAEGVIVETDPPRPGYEYVTLQRGGYVTLHGDEPFVITATGPILVSHFLTGSAYPGHGEECNGKGLGDPAMTMEVPVVQWTTRAVAIAYPGLDQHYLDVVRKPGPTLRLNGLVIEPTATAIEGTDWEWFRLPLLPGTHLLESDGPFAATAYGYGCGASYAYPAGTNHLNLVTPPPPPFVPTPLPAPTPTPGENPGDQDEDSITDDVDNCPDVSNTDQQDFDQDGHGDACDPDVDGDAAPNNIDCEPFNPAVSPLLPEICDEIDNDCDLSADEPDAIGCQDFFVDNDGDGAGNAGFALCLCTPTPPYQALFGGDCFDNDPFIHPWVTEKCDNVDNDCNGAVDEGCDDDDDDWCDGELKSTGGVLACPNGSGDCVDYSPEISPGQVEIPGNLIDDNCDGLVDDETEADKDPDCLGLPCVGTTLQALLCSAEFCYGPDYVLDVDVESPTDTPTLTMFSALEHLGDPGNGLAPKSGNSYLVLSTGDVHATSNHDLVLGGTPEADPFPSFSHQTVDSVELVLKLKAPNGATGFRLDYVFLSTGFEEGIGTAASDKFYIIVEGPITTSGEPVATNYGACIDPDFYSDISIDDQPMCFIDVNSAFGESCADGPATSIAGTGYECGSSNDAGDGSSTGWLRTISPIAENEPFTLRLHIHDTQSGNSDSAVIIDNFHWVSGDVSYGTFKIDTE